MKLKLSSSYNLLALLALSSLLVLVKLKHAHACGDVNDNEDCINCEILDTDQDGIPDTKDNCPFIPNPAQTDLDKDGIGDEGDNCPNQANPDQSDSNKDGIGDACELTRQ